MDCPLAAAIRHNQMTPSGRTGDEIRGLIFRRMERVTRDRPWIRAEDPGWFRREVDQALRGAERRAEYRARLEAINAVDAMEREAA